MWTYKKYIIVYALLCFVIALYDYTTGKLSKQAFHKMIPSLIKLDIFYFFSVNFE